VGRKNFLGHKGMKFNIQKKENLYFPKYFLNVETEKMSLKTRYTVNSLFHCLNCVNSYQAKAIDFDKFNKHSYLTYKVFLMYFGFSFLR